jgi:preprotein translocase SecE subunit
MAVVAMFGCYRLWRIIVGASAADAAEEAASQAEAISVMGLSVPGAALWAGGVFIVLSCLIAVLTLGIATPFNGLNKAIHGFNDLLIDTQTELAKVVWPTSQKLVRATTAVITTVVILGVFLYVVDEAIKAIVTVLIPN